MEDFSDFYEFPELDGLVEIIRDMKSRDKESGTVLVLNPQKIKIVNDIAARLKEYAATHDGEVECGIRRLTGSGYITASFPVIEESNLDFIKEVADTMDNCEIQVVGGKIQFGFVLYGCFIEQPLS